MDPEALRRALHDHLVDEVLLRNEPLAADQDLFDAGFDSMSLSRVLVFIEEQYGVVIPDEEVVLDEIATLAQLTEFVGRYLRDSQP